MTEGTIRLAHYQGLLSQKELNRFQRYAAEYWLRMDRRITVRDIEDTLQRQTWYMDPQRYQQLFLMGEIAPPTSEDMPFEEEEVVDNLDDIDDYFAKLEQQRTVSGAEVFAAIDDDQGWV